MSDIENQPCTEIVEILIPGPQGPKGGQGSDIGGYEVAIENIQEDDLLIFDGTEWKNGPASSIANGDMLKEVYDPNDTGIVERAAVADAVAWENITQVPTSFPPSTHSHSIANVEGLGAALEGKAPLASPALTGTPTAPTADSATSNNQIATTEFVTSAIAAINLDDWDFVPNTRSITAGNGLTGGGNLTENRAIALSSASIASLALADTAIQPGDLGELALKDQIEITDIDASGTPSANTYLAGNGQWSTPVGAGDLVATNNLSDLDDVAEARINLGLGTAAAEDATSFATSAQGALADSAVQPGDLATVATSGDYDDLSNKPTIPDPSSFVVNSRTISAGAGLAGGGDLSANRTIALSSASIASLGKADTAVQPGDLGTLASKNQVAAADVADNAVLTGKINNSAVTFAKIQNIATQTLVGRTASGTGVSSAITFANLRAPLSHKPLIHSYDASDLSGLTQIVVTLPEDYSVFELICNSLSSASNSTITLRCGTSTTLDSGANDYAIQILSGIGTSAAANASSAPGVSIAQIGPDGNNILKALISDGSNGGNWRVIAEQGHSESSGYRVVQRFGIRSASGIKKRFGMIFGTTLQSSGSIRIYGVR